MDNKAKMEVPLVQVLTDTEALAVVQLAGQRLRSAACTLPRDRRGDVKWVAAKVSQYLEGSADPATARRVLLALSSLPLPELTKVKLLNARATTEIAAFLADSDMQVEAVEVAQVIEGAWAAAAGGGSSGGDGAARFHEGGAQDKAQK